MKSNDMIIFASTVMSDFSFMYNKKILGFGGKKRQNILLVIAARVGDHLDSYL